MTDDHAPQVEALAQPLEELVGGPPAELAGELENDQTIEPGGVEERGLLVERGQPRRTVVGVEDAPGMGVEGDEDGLAAVLTGRTDHAVDDPAMAAVDAVEVPDAEEGEAVALARALRQAELGLQPHHPASTLVGR